ncbi:MAG TPA: D-glycerate dehydrogenase [Acidimicrobiales bacterium]|nr:D-glycerate dehydrogenase [Acidimicrobiales bacterium]
MSAPWREPAAAAPGELPRVFLTRLVPGATLARLAAGASVEVWQGAMPPGPAELAAACRGAVGLLSTTADRVDGALLDACPSLAVVSNLAVGYDNVDVPAMTLRHVPVGNTPGVLTDATADLAFALILATARRVVEARDAVLDGRWTAWDPGFMLGMELAGSTLGILGLGRIGRAVARRALGFDMRVVAWSRSGRVPLGAGLERVELVSFDELFETSDALSVHVALAPSTVHLVGAEQLAAMKPTAILVNTSRGPVVDQAALFAALQSRSIAAAGLDVVEVEPIPLDDPLLGIDNCIVLPHIGSATTVTRTRMAELAVDNLLSGIRGEILAACVNPEVYDFAR